MNMKYNWTPTDWQVIKTSGSYRLVRRRVYKYEQFAIRDARTGQIVSEMYSDSYRASSELSRKICSGELR
jgi:hypothetical protein